jgi:threonine aldolase
VPEVVDLRSDTVTRPTAAMRAAMAEAEVGDDGYGEDPTVARLESAFAERVGKEESLFVPSGTMANQIAFRLLGRPGTSVLVGRRQHVVAYEAGAAAVNGSAQLDLLDDDGGVLHPHDVRAAIDAVADHWPRVSAVFVEDTHMPSGGLPWPDGALAAVAALGPPVHLDGARLFNAEVATGVPVADRAGPATTVMCCLSKGLGAPVGSLLAGPADLVARARVERRRLGGAMRQAGVLAAAGLVALDEMVDRLADDHERAHALAVAVRGRWPDAGIDPAGVRTNIVVFRHPDAHGLCARLHHDGVWAGTIAPGVVRLVTHLDVGDDALDRAVEVIGALPPEW